MCIPASHLCSPRSPWACPSTSDSISWQTHHPSFRRRVHQRQPNAAPSACWFESSRTRGSRQPGSPWRLFDLIDDRCSSPLVQTNSVLSPRCLAKDDLIQLDGGNFQRLCIHPPSTETWLLRKNQTVNLSEKMFSDWPEPVYSKGVEGLVHRTSAEEKLRHLPMVILCNNSPDGTTTRNRQTISARQDIRVLRYFEMTAASGFLQVPNTGWQPPLGSS